MSNSHEPLPAKNERPRLELAQSEKLQVVFFPGSAVSPSTLLPRIQTLSRGVIRSAMEAAAQSHPLPLLQDIDPGVRRFLDGRFRSAADLATASDVEAEIRGHCAELEASISNLYVRLQEAAAAYSSCCEVAGSALRGVRGGLGALKASGSTGMPNTHEVLKLRAY